MSVLHYHFDALPEPRRAAMAKFAALLAELAGDNVLGLCAFGGWIVADRCFAEASARSVVVLREDDLSLLDRLASHGARLGRRGLAAPFVMTPAYIRDSCDVFPLELLEIQQLHACLGGEDHFTDLRFEPRELRLECERELKSVLIHLRQGLVAAAGHRPRLDRVCAAAAERTLRILRGLLHLAGLKAPPLALDLLTSTAAATGLRLVTLARVAVGTDGLGFDGLQRCYQEVAALASYANALDGASNTRGTCQPN